MHSGIGFGRIVLQIHSDIVLNSSCQFVVCHCADCGTLWLWLWLFCIHGNQLFLEVSVKSTLLLLGAQCEGNCFWTQTYKHTHKHTHTDAGAVQCNSCYMLPLSWITVNTTHLAQISDLSLFHHSWNHLQMPMCVDVGLILEYILTIGDDVSMYT